MSAASGEREDDTKPVPPEVQEKARSLVQEFPECLWFRHPDAPIQGREDVRVIIEHLREYGGHRAWWEAQCLQQCL